MGILYSGVVDADQQTVFDWHTRPGAFVRLSPPWQPLQPEVEAGSLREGRAVLTLPGGLRWVAQHDPAGYDPPRRFVDAITTDGPRSLPMRAAVASWRHTHDFAPEGDGRTRVTDRVDSPIPEFLLRPVFAYRHRQLADDLAAHRWAAEQGVVPLTIAMTGSSGLVGSALSAFLTSGGHRVVRLVRHEPRGDGERRWDPEAPAADLLTGVDAVIHLAGAPIAGRFTDAHRRAIRDSRVGPTRRLAELAAGGANGPRIFLCASAIGYYGPDRNDEVLTESSDRGAGFLADVVADWEEATAPARDAEIRVVNIRTGIVQSPRGGTLHLLYPIFAAGLGGRLGDGRQWMSWIGIDDLVDIYHRALFETELQGPVNAVAPEPVRNSAYTRVLAKVLRRPALLPVPGIGPRLLLGEQGVRELAEADQRVAPDRLAELGHRFRHPTLEAALRHQLGRTAASG